MQQTLAAKLLTMFAQLCGCDGWPEKKERERGGRLYNQILARKLPKKGRLMKKGFLLFCSPPVLVCVGSFSGASKI